VEENAVVFAPHPRSKRTTMKVVDIMRDVLVKIMPRQISLSA